MRNYYNSNKRRRPTTNQRRPDPVFSRQRATSATKRVATTPSSMLLSEQSRAAKTRSPGHLPAELASVSLLYPGEERPIIVTRPRMHVDGHLLHLLLARRGRLGPTRLVVKLRRPCGRHAPRAKRPAAPTWACIITGRPARRHSIAGAAQTRAGGHDATWRPQKRRDHLLGH